MLRFTSMTQQHCFTNTTKVARSRRTLVHLIPFQTLTVPNIFTLDCCLRDHWRSDAVTVLCVCFRAGGSLQEEGGARADDRLEASAASADWARSFSPRTPTHQQASRHWRPVAEWPHHPHCSRAPPAGGSALTAAASARCWSHKGAWSERSLSSAESFYSRNFDARPSLSPVHSVCIEGCGTPHPPPHPRGL